MKEGELESFQRLERIGGTCRDVHDLLFLIHRIATAAFINGLITRVYAGACIIGLV